MIKKSLPIVRTQSLHGPNNSSLRFPDELQHFRNQRMRSYWPEWAKSKGPDAEALLDEVLGALGKK